MNTGRELHALGKGTQRKSYLYVQDCIDGILVALDRAAGHIKIFNLGTDEYSEVADSVRWICEHLALSPAIRYSGGDRGWVGDNPFIYLDCSRVRALGWRPPLAIRGVVIRTLTHLENNPTLLAAQP